MYFLIFIHSDDMGSDSSEAYLNADELVAELKGQLAPHEQKYLASFSEKATPGAVRYYDGYVVVCIDKAAYQKAKRQGG
jgi:hypothetical protein